ncbi:MAG: rod shape-determining protein MreC [Terracidiphilus sp.]
MDSIFTRYRNLVVLLVILVAQMIALGAQVRRTALGRNMFDPQDQSGVRLIRLWANAVVAPPEKAIHYTKLGAVGLWRDYIDLEGVRKQNAQLEQTVGRLRLEQAELVQDAQQGQRLQALLGFEEHYIYKTLAAQVYGSGGNQHSYVFYIDKGEADGLKRDMAVVTAEGIVGKVRDVFPHSAQVLAINDQTSGAGVILATTRIRGILRGNANGQLEVVGVSADERIKPGEKVLTAGGDLIFPRGLAVGEVEKVVPDPDRDGLIDILLKPAAHLDRLDEVLVITSMEPRFSGQQKQDIAASEAEDGAQAAAIETQIQAQQKAAQINAERLPSLIVPNVPPDQQPIDDSSNPGAMAEPPQPLHRDQFSPLPGDAVVPGVSDDMLGGRPAARTAAGKKAAAPAGSTAKPHSALPRAPAAAKPAQASPGSPRTGLSPRGGPPGRNP